MFIVSKEVFGYYDHTSSIYGCYETKEEADNAANDATNGLECSLKHLASDGMVEKDFLRGETWIAYKVNNLFKGETFVYYHVHCDIKS